MDALHNKDSSKVEKTGNFNLPLKCTKSGDYKLHSSEVVYTCFTSDFFLKEADEWRKDVWEMIRFRSDLHFFIITKRIDRFYASLPNDWGEGYENVTIACTVENQKMADYRLPLFLEAPVRHKDIICEPILEAIDLSAYLSSVIESVIVGGESGTEARECNYDWVLAIREQCRAAGVSFTFRQTGRHFRKDGRLYTLRRELHRAQAKKAGIDLP
jgi:protein gp37